jgi:hypothetical protein
MGGHEPWTNVVGEAVKIAAEAGLKGTNTTNQSAVGSADVVAAELSPPTGPGRSNEPPAHDA